MIRTRRRRQELQLRQSDSEQKLTSAPEGLSGGGAAGGWRALRTLRMLCTVRCACLAPAGMCAAGMVPTGLKGLAPCMPPLAQQSGMGMQRGGSLCSAETPSISYLVFLCRSAARLLAMLTTYTPGNPATSSRPCCSPTSAPLPLPGWIVSYDDIEILKHPDGSDML